MTDKEWLEEIKKRYNYERLGEFIDVKPVNTYELRWLIQQAERVQELELEISDWMVEVQKWQKFYKESEGSHSETKELLKSIVNRNKQYREAIEVAIHNMSGDNLGDKYALGILEQALESEK